jgi:hypothetical protein
MLTNPALSAWVLRTSTSGSCSAVCADNCAAYAQINSGFRSALFSALGS